ncbi:PAS domain-containing sensor histidine kinase [Desulfocurvibacter africanus]|uniref:histidine kinase n=1 Tax=Desulfocurvibacter africanus subsp. africanus str. Walvis Bay TaxID=690850 RepID=F3YXT2_DESAF|nr:PAS domain S-box protein [Desulfocurvibacter africanus]EGJ49526.1 PAS/PAC sensor signal transduction histidine kinase [Desulfocurvibacter africanus subsp. africanus str. Walvis Bay]
MSEATLPNKSKPMVELQACPSLGGLRPEEMYRNIFEGVPCLVAVLDRNFRLVSWNRTFSEHMEVKPGDCCYQAFWGRDCKCVRCPVEETFADGRFHTSEETGAYKDGSLAHWIVTTAPVTDASGEIVGAIKMCLDITSRKALEEKLKRSEEKYHAIFSDFPYSIFLLDTESLAIIDCNARTTASYGFSHDELVGTCFLDLFRDGDKQAIAADLLRSGHIHQARHGRKNGQAFYVAIRASRCEYPGRKVLLVTTSDITKRLETEQQLIQASKMATLGEMATGMAHELNQPLTVIQSGVDLILRKLSQGQALDSETLRNVAELMAEHVDRAANIINHMREFGRKSDLRREPVQAGEVLRRAFDIFREQFALRGIEVRFELDDGLPDILADRNRLEQVFINILINARDALEAECAGGPDASDSWAVEAGPADKRLMLTATAQDDWVLIRIRDTGVGVPPALREKIFEPFFTTKEVGKGTGLGLSITYGIVKDHGGNVEVEPTAGPGTCFLLRFPAILSATAASPEAASSHTNEPKNPSKPRS